MHLVLAAFLCAHCYLDEQGDVNAPFGFVYKPAFTVDEHVRLPAEIYEPQPGDIVFFDDHDVLWQIGFYFAGAGRPMHVGIVVRQVDGQLASLEAGYNDTIWVKMIPLAERLHEFKGKVWVRRRLIPLTERESERLTEFAQGACHKLFAVHRLLLQGTPLRCRGIVRTYFVGKPQGMKPTFMCSECVVEALVYADLLDEETSRPAATYPRDLFFDSSPNRYLNRHFKLAPAWIPPQLWTPAL
jgi:hypothetical protein